MANTERSFLMIKPDGVQRGIVGEIIKRFEAKGFRLVAMKLTWVSGVIKLLLFFVTSTMMISIIRALSFRLQRSCWKSTTLI